jgi:diguanylate cyclase (GGDEF)-like protein/putative nucleotidyltransferase with HDIG domain
MLSRNKIDNALIHFRGYLKKRDTRLERCDLSNRMSNILEIDKVASIFLSGIREITNSVETTLLISEDDLYKSSFCSSEASPAELVLRDTSPIAGWLRKNEGIITTEMLDGELKLNSDEADAIKSGGISLLCPVKNHDKLIAIAALSKKQDNNQYSTRERDVLMKVCHEAAVIIENALLYKRAKQQATTDELTGVFNQNYFHQRMEEEIARSTRFGEVFTVIFLDIDNFKQHNDNAGHLVGDQIIRNIGQTIKNNLRESDLCFRYGGDEFAIVLPKTSLEGSGVVAQRILDEIPKLKTVSKIPLTVSLGIASWPTDGVLKNDIIHSADAALYHSKHKGKNCVNLACEVALSEVFRIESFANQSDKDIGALLKTIFALAVTVDAKDPFTQDHSKNVTRYSTEIAEAMHFTDEGVERIRIAALLHDIGKIGIPDNILHKKGLLTYDEREIMQAHPNLGVAIIQHVPKLKECIAAIQYHHENYNGTGYPAGLKGSNIPLDARILQVADAFDAMISPRWYRRTYSFEEALVELKNCSGTQFDPEIVKAFLRIKSGIKNRQSLAEKQVV